MSAMTQQLSDKQMKEIFGADVFLGAVFANEPMKDHTTLRIGGPADIYVMPKNMLSLKNLVITLSHECIPAMPVGGGSNLLVSDEGIAGAVISTVVLNHIEVMEESADEVRLFSEAGAPLQKLVNLCRAQGYGGIEGLAGIPGCIGGAIRGNAGSHGQEIGDIVESVTVIDGKGNVFSLDRGDLGFGYRRSDLPETAIVLSTNVRLTKDDPRSVVKKMTEVLQEKMRKQPIAQFSAGSVFKNPPGAHAGRLIDEAGCKGMKRGDVEVSGLHANFFVNRGKGLALDFVELMEEVRGRVLKAFGVELEPEIRIVGRFGSAGNR